jgi:hypothetical protein
MVYVGNLPKHEQRGYEATVEAGVAIKHETKVMLDINGQFTQNATEQFGRKTKHQLTKPEHCIYIDETNCHTNMMDDGHIGGRWYVMAADQTKGAHTGVTVISILQY